MWIDKTKVSAWHNKNLMTESGGKVNGSRCNYDWFDKRTGC
jgi:NAD(P)H-dependent FMN reductase